MTWANSQTGLPSAHHVQNVGESRENVCSARQGHGRGGKSEVGARTTITVFSMLTKSTASQTSTPSPANTRRKLSSNVRSHDDEGQEIRQRDLTSGDNVDGYTESNLSSHQPTAKNSHTRQLSASTLENSMMRTVVSSGNDALNILFEAAAHSQEADLAEARMDSRDTSRAVNAMSYENAFSQMHSAVPTGIFSMAIRPVEISNASKEVLTTWETCRFVMMGWFTSREAVTLIDL